MFYNFSVGVKCVITTRLLTRLGRGVAEAVSSRLLTADGLVQSQDHVVFVVHKVAQGQFFLSCYSIIVHPFTTNAT